MASFDRQRRGGTPTLAPGRYSVATDAAGGHVTRDDVDPMEAQTVAELAACLRRLRISAGSPSYRRLEQWGLRHRKRLARSSVSDALAGRRLPPKDLLMAFVQACGINPVADTRWIAAWTMLAYHGTEQPPGSDAVPGQLAADIRTAGLLRIGTTYLAEADWNELFDGVRELDIFVAYGQTWRHLHARELEEVAVRDDATIRVFLADPEDAQTMSVLADRFGTTPAELRTRVEGTRREYEKLRRPGGADVKIYYWPGDRIFSFYRLDGVAVVGFYSHTRSRAAAVPVFVCGDQGELYQFVLGELDTVLAGSRLI
jgi:hypothetical protein